jgi:hypothetical protein
MTSGLYRDKQHREVQGCLPQSFKHTVNISNTVATSSGTFSNTCVMVRVVSSQQIYYNEIGNFTLSDGTSPSIANATNSSFLPANTIEWVGLHGPAGTTQLSVLSASANGTVNIVELDVGIY